MNRPRRVLLFVPATERRKIEKAAGLPVDGVIVDLEDATVLAHKEEGRAGATAALAAIDFGPRERIVRINPAGTDLADADLAALLAAPVRPDAILIPKVQSADEVQRIGRALDGTEIRLLALIESSLGVVHLERIAAADDRLVALAFGAEDLRGEMGATRSEVPRSLVAIHAAARGLQAIDTPTIDLDDMAVVTAHASEALELGYDGKFAIHPRQIEPIERVFHPSPEETDRARHLLAEHERHQAEGRGVFEIDGKMVDMPMVRAARKIVRLAGE
jgi:citrate lyase beta subunit